ncbi:MAG: phosphopantetheine attachment domain protein [Actinophytocola sp.]|uniref:phosphopantetheine-binding protein n=1 Tax=Actinophytocola sp. TaxID=1872138 RepID=UPI0013276C08|nr:phosphopantetheine-binding protein [Actinophytocola sp.]MPZ86335.1 phosphopantetheine attachment domain protein [Actinophytocola sp.]
MAESLTRAAVRADVAEILCTSPDNLSEMANMFESGIDSIRLMTLLERWREAGARVSFVELAERPSLADWLTLLVGTRG